jgi:hypothetical protein
VNRFADLLDMLAFTPSRNAKLALLQDHFRTVPDPERGYALAAIARDLDIPAVKPAQLRELISSRMDRSSSAIPMIMSATWPKPSRWPGRKRRTPARAATTHPDWPRWLKPCRLHPP